MNLVYGSRFLRIPLPPEMSAKLNRDFDKHAVWRTFGPMLDYWREQPEIKVMGTFEQRVAGFDLSADPAWVCIEVNFFDRMNDEMLMLLKLKFDLSTEQHRPRRPAGGWVL